MKIAYQGEPGAFSEAAARRVGADAALVPCRSFEEVFAAVEQGPAQYGVLPIENSIGGSIHRNYDLLLEHQLPIVGEVELPVVHHLLALPGRDARRPAARLLASAGAGAVRAVPADADRRRDHRDLRHGRQREDGGRRQARRTPRRSRRRAPARCSASSPLASSIQDFDDNITRFLVIGRRPLQRRVARQDVDRVLAAERAGLAVQGAERLRAARHRPDQARVAADSRAGPGNTCSTSTWRRRATSCRARARWRTWPSSRRCCARSAPTRAGRRARAGMPDPFEVVS